MVGTQHFPNSSPRGTGWVKAGWVCPLSTLDPSPRVRTRHRLLLGFSQHLEHVGAHVDKTLASHLGSVRQEP